MILPKFGFPQIQRPKPSVLTSELSAACPCTCQQLQCRTGTGSEAAGQPQYSLTVLWYCEVPVSGEISKEEKPIVPIHPHLKQVPDKPWIPKPFSHERQHHHYSKQHPEAAGDPCPVPTSHKNSTPDTVYFKLLPHQVTKMIVRVGHGSPVPVQYSPGASLNASQSTARKSVPSLCPEDPTHRSRQFQRQPVRQGKLHAALSPAD